MEDHGSHTFANYKNFGLHQGALKIRDYGKLGLDFLMKNYGEQIKQALAEVMAKKNQQNPGRPPNSSGNKSRLNQKILRNKRSLSQNLKLPTTYFKSHAIFLPPARF